MQRKTLATLLFLLSFCLATPSFAGEPQLGVGLHTGGGLSSPPATIEGLGSAGALGSLGGLGGFGSLVSAPSGGAILVPVNIGEAFRLEPAFGFSASSSELESSGEVLKRSTTGLTAAVGAFYRSQLTPRTVMVVGPRVGMGRSSSEQTLTGQTVSSSRLSYSLSAVTGAEYFLSPKLSFGGEVSLTGTYLGDTDQSGAGTTSEDPKDTAMNLGTGAAIRLCWYVH